MWNIMRRINFVYVLVISQSVTTAIYPCNNAILSLLGHYAITAVN